MPGEDFVVRCEECGYAANLEKAASQTARAGRGRSRRATRRRKSFTRPDVKTIAEVAAFTGLPETSQMKSLVMVADGKPVLVMLRGDHQLSETKLAAVLKATEVRPAQPDEICDWFGANAGSLGPVGVKNMRVLADRALAGAAT